MKQLGVVLTLLVIAATAAPAQSRWTREIGVQGGFARVKPAGTGVSDHSDGFSIPGLSLGSLLPGPSGIFVVLPAGQKLAVEPSISWTELTTPGSTSEIVTLGLRGNYALTSKLYAAVGAGLNYSDAGGTSDHQFGVQAAFGYRLRVSGALNGRVEASWATWASTDNTSAFNTYALQFGLSAPLQRAAARRAAAPSARRPRIGLSGGYVRVHEIQGADLLTFGAPGITHVLNSTGAGAPPTLFASFPLGDRMWIEPGLDLLRLQSEGTTTTAGQLTGRLAYTVTGGWYASGGLHVVYVRNTGVDAGMTVGGNLGWGYRFPLVADLGGRVELSLFHTPRNEDIGFGAHNTVGLTFGLTMPVK